MCVGGVCAGGEASECYNLLEETRHSGTGVQGSGPNCLVKLLWDFESMTQDLGPSPKW